MLSPSKSHAMLGSHDENQNSLIHPELSEKTLGMHFEQSTNQGPLIYETHIEKTCHSLFLTNATMFDIDKPYSASAKLYY